MNIVEQFTVTRPIESVWGLFQDVPELAQCLPGAELTIDNDDGTYEGRVAVKLGPISSSFDGKATIVFDSPCGMHSRTQKPLISCRLDLHKFNDRWFTSLVLGCN